MTLSDVAAFRKLEARIVELEKRCAELEAKRGPGRPKTVKEENGGKSG